MWSGVDPWYLATYYQRRHFNGPPSLRAVRLLSGDDSVVSDGGGGGSAEQRKHLLGRAAAVDLRRVKTTTTPESDTQEFPHFTANGIHSTAKIGRKLRLTATSPLHHCKGSQHSAVAAAASTRETHQFLCCADVMHLPADLPPGGASPFAASVDAARASTASGSSSGMSDILTGERTLSTVLSEHPGRHLLQTWVT